MKILKQFLIGGAVGFIAGLAVILFGDVTIEFSKYADAAVISLFVIIAVLMGLSLLLYRQVKRLNHSEFNGDEEDEADVLKYKKFTDYSLFIQSSMTLSILALSIALIAAKNMVFVVIAIVALIVSYLFTAYMLHLMRLVYPHRNIPALTDPDYTVKLLEAADEGEKHVMFNGLYKAYNLLSIALIIAVVCATLYSLYSDHSQLFSIIAMCIVLLLVNGKYLLAVRNK